MMIAEREGKVIKAEGEGGKEVSETNAVRLEGGERTFLKRGDWLHEEKGG